MPKIYPNATINEIKNNASSVRSFSYGPRPNLKKYQKGQFTYTYDILPFGGEEINAMHLPTKKMFTYNFRTKKWENIM